MTLTLLNLITLCLAVVILVRSLSVAYVVAINKTGNVPHIWISLPICYIIIFFLHLN